MRAREPDEVTPESKQPGADNRDDETTTGFLAQRIQFKSAFSEIIRPALPSGRALLPRNLAKSHLATDRSDRAGETGDTSYEP